MLVSLREISKYIDLSDITPEQIASRLTDAGIEVEEIKYASTATKLVIGEVLSCENHPESDHLHLCKVDVKDEILDIVCGAPNVRKGLKVIVATVGSKLPLGDIKASTIRGHQSFGMLCSLKELGVDDKYLTEAQINGIEELPSDAEVGNKEVLKYLGLDDCILDLKLLANRSDCLSLFNVAREIGALFNKKVNVLTSEPIGDQENNVNVGSSTQNSTLFTSKIFKNVKITDSPKWLQDILRSQGVRSINNVVDIGNYVMLLTGQPVHMYDLDKLPKNELIVKDDFEGEVIALDEKTYKLNQGDLVVTSNNVPVCIAGIMGLKNVEVTKETKNIVLEVASFYGAAVRKTSNRLGLFSDSATRYIKGVNVFNVDNVINLISKYLLELTQPESISVTNKYNEDKREIKIIKCDLAYINNRLGTEFTLEEVIEVLEKLYFKIDNVKDNNFEVTVPTFRLDVETKADLSEEIIRYKGFSYIKESLPIMETTIGGRSIIKNKVNVIKDYLLGLGLHEILTYTLLNKTDNERFNYLNNDECFEVLNPLTEDHKYVRRNLLSSVLNTTEYNLSHLNRNFGLFEIGNSESKNVNEIHLAIALSGEHFGIDLFNAKKFDVLDMKGILFNILNMFNISQSRIRLERILDTKEFHPYRSMKVLLDNKLLAVLGEVHPKIKDKFNFNKDNLVLLELNLSRLFNTRTGNNKASEYSKFPSVTRDYAFIVKDTVDYQNIVKELKKASSLIKNVELFDLYKGDNIEKGYVSIALSLTLEKMEATFSNEEISQIDNKIRDVILNKINGALRS